MGEEVVGFVGAAVTGVGVGIGEAIGEGVATGVGEGEIGVPVGTDEG